MSTTDFSVFHVGPLLDPIDPQLLNAYPRAQNINGALRRWVFASSVDKFLSQNMPGVTFLMTPKDSLVFSEEKRRSLVGVTIPMVEIDPDTMDPAVIRCDPNIAQVFASLENATFFLVLSFLRAVAEWTRSPEDIRNMYSIIEIYFQNGFMPMTITYEPCDQSAWYPDFVKPCVLRI